MDNILKPFRAQTRISNLIFSQLLIFLFSTSLLYGQISRESFCWVREIRTIKNVAWLTSGDFNGNGLTDLVTVSNRIIAIHFQQDYSVDWRIVQIPLKHDIKAIAATKLNNDRLTDLVVLTDDPPKIETYLSLPNEKIYLRWTAQLQRALSEVVVGDINSDGKMDIVIYGKYIQGILIYLGKGDGTFRDPITMFDDLSFSYLVINDMNYDRINDLIAVDWLSNRILIFMGYGRIKFFEPLFVEFENEPAFFSPAVLDSSSMKALIVGFIGERSIKTLTFRENGRHHTLQTLRLESFPSQIEIQDINNDGQPDLFILGKDQSFSIFFNNGKGLFHHFSVFSAGRNPRRFEIFKHGKTNYINTAVLDDIRNRLKIFYHHKLDLPIEKQYGYAVGLSPQQVVLFDVNLDGLNDLLTANSESRTASILINRGNGTFHGQISVPTSIKAAGIIPLRRNDSTFVIILTHPEEERIGVVEVNCFDYSSTSHTIHGYQKAEIVTTWMDQDRLINVVLRDTTMWALKNPFTLFSEFIPLRFVERTIAPYKVPTSIIAIESNFTDELKNDFAYLIYKEKEGVIELFQYNRTNGEQNISHRLVTQIKSPPFRNAYLWSMHLNYDNIADYIINIHDFESKIYTVLSRKENLLSNPIQSIMELVKIPSPRHLKNFDITGDGIQDIILENSVDKKIRIYIGKGDGTFLPGISLLGTDGIGGFEVSDINNDGMAELFVTEILDGILKVISLE